MALISCLNKLIKGRCVHLTNEKERPRLPTSNPVPLDGIKKMYIYFQIIVLKSRFEGGGKIFGMDQN